MLGIRAEENEGVHLWSGVLGCLDRQYALDIDCVTGGVREVMRG